MQGVSRRSVAEPEPERYSMLCAGSWIRRASGSAGETGHNAMNVVIRRAGGVEISGAGYFLDISGGHRHVNPLRPSTHRLAQRKNINMTTIWWYTTPGRNPSVAL